ncbi:MAG: PHP domain-containing protein, partial [Pseudomonadales bacterium]|nr:PHP domain-containing protein [Pseudomonadales bacterium]
MSPGYAELHCITNYSFLRGASHPEELVARAAQLGYKALAVTDECSMAGAVKAHVAARAFDLKLIVGSEFFLDEDIHLVLLAPDRVAYGQICNLISVARRRADKGEYRLSLRDLEFGLNRCLALWLPDSSRDHQLNTGRQLKTVFQDRLWITLEIFPEGREIDSYRQALTLAETLALPLVAGGDVHMHHPDR